MIDLHSHILPGIDDGAATVADSLDIARAAVADGIAVLACTPHILPGLYHNAGPMIREATSWLQGVLNQEDIPLTLVAGADVHLVPDMIAGLKAGRLLSIADTRYVLVEPPHHVAPAHMEDFFFGLLLAGYVPILTHPERLSWIEGHYDAILRLAQGGVWMQITAGSVIGEFGRSARYWAERLLDDRCVHIIASDAHDIRRRPPRMTRAREVVARRLGEREAYDLVVTRPQGVLDNAGASSLPAAGASAVVQQIPDEGARRSGRSVRHHPSHDRSQSGLRTFGGRLRRLLG